ncbi:hypothetical protein HIM_09754 [Hirsutella minnesotensis 3608]|uniref:ATP-dependent DNA helicase n=1 Tax=Hirsutella minnesotensis 3608 TaxID=1043627 RepID=A0A0F7ZKY9_9HYPO|nr:hypothetical protein HIM_09754 [Hirsutella minnesotensis 3608]
MIQGIQSTPAAWESDRRAALRRVMTGFGEDEVEMTTADSDETAIDAGAEMDWPINPLPRLDLMQQTDGGDACQLRQFVGGEGGTGKSRIIEALVELFSKKRLSNRLLITATSGTAAARINGITIPSACGFTKDQGAGANMAKDLDVVRLPKQAERFVHGQSRMDWQEKDVLVIDEVSMLGSRTLHAVNEQLRRLRGSRQDFGGIPIVLFCGDFHQFRPVQERSIVLPSAAIPWDVDNSFKAEQQHQPACRS